MKKCPTCEKTFEDSMRFCQVDGTPLVDDAPAFDPYATIVAQADAPAEEASVEEVDIEAGDPQPEPSPVDNAVDEAATSESPSATAIEVPDNVLDLPETDPLKTMYVSDAEMQAALDEDEPAADIVEIPPIEESPAPEPPNFSVPDVPAPSFGDLTPPPSPFSASGSVQDKPVAAPAEFDEPAPVSPMFDEMETVIQPEMSTPFDPSPLAPVEEWTPPPAPDASWQNQEIGSNTPFQPPPPGAGGQNKTLAIVSLVCGILGMTVCCGSFAVSIAALVIGFIARGKASQNPQEYGGAGLAMAGIITGALGTILSVIIIILYFVGALAGFMGNF